MLAKAKEIGRLQKQYNNQEKNKPLDTDETCFRGPHRSRVHLRAYIHRSEGVYVSAFTPSVPK
jgi:hypothetical protein